MLQDNSPRPTSLDGCNVLVLEDEPLILLMLEDQLADMGCASVTGAVHTARALEILDSRRIDLAILDVHLKDELTSFEVATRLTSRGTPFIFSTGSAGEDLLPGFANAPVIGKPFTQADLEQALQTALLSAHAGPPTT